MSDEVLGASFRDPSGYVFERGGVVYRQVSRTFAADYDQLMSSGLYQRLVDKGLLIPHEEVELPALPAAPGRGNSLLSAEPYRTLRPEQLDFVSYPYEWCFSQLKDAALLTCHLQREALAHDMTLKDASVYNVQFHRGRAVMIDTLSFERFREGAWVGYRQFCQHFLAPLALMSLRDVRLSQLLRSHIDGVPLDLATSLLPARSWLRLGLLTNIRLHAGSQQMHAAAGAADQEAEKSSAPKLSKQAVSNLIHSLEGTVKKLRWEPRGTEWAEYYSGDSYEGEALEHKQRVVAEYLGAIAPERVWDLGANTGVYSRIAAETGAHVVAFDVDPACVERNYLEVRKQKEQRVLPLLLDLVNPSPAIGWANDERASLAERRHPDAILALALIHHLAISNNVPLSHIARFFAELAPALVIEFVPKTDAKVKVLLASREDIFPRYTREGFEEAFSAWFEIEQTCDLPGSERTLYRMRRRS